MSCLYSSPELLPWIALRLDRLTPESSHADAARAHAHRITMPSESVPNVANHRVQQKTRTPPRRHSSPADQIIHPAETSRSYCPRLLLRRLLLRKSSSAISGFRSRCGQEQHSDCARMDLRFGTFQSAGFRFWTLPASNLRGQRPCDRCCERNVVSPGRYSKWFFRVSIGLYRGDLRAPTARRTPARSALGGPGMANPAAVSKPRISPA